MIDQIGAAGQGRNDGWRIVAFAGIVFAMSAPGQTIGVSVFIEPMTTSLGVTRSQLSVAYLVATLLGAAAMPFLGKLIDQHGPRLALRALAAAFGLAVVAMAGVGGLPSLFLGFVGIRMLGQGSLPLVSGTSVAVWFDQGRGVAVGVSNALGTALIALTPLLFAAIISGAGWRWAWAFAGIAVWIVLLPLARWMRDPPDGLDRQIDGFRPDAGIGRSAGRAAEHMTRAAAVRTITFWVLCGAVAAIALIGSGLVFHQISILGERGLTRFEAASNFLPQAAAAIGTMLVAGPLTDRIRPRLSIAIAMMAIISALLLVRVAAPGIRAIGFGVALGVAGGMVRTIEGALLPRLFGTTHIGAIRGFVFAIGVAASSLGPLIFSLSYDHFGSYQPILGWLAIVPVIPAALSLVAPLSVPSVRSPRRHGEILAAEVASELR